MQQKTKTKQNTPFTRRRFIRCKKPLLSLHLDAPAVHQRAALIDRRLLLALDHDVGVHDNDVDRSRQINLDQLLVAPHTDVIFV